MKIVASLFTRENNNKSLPLITFPLNTYQTASSNARPKNHNKPTKILKTACLGY